MQNYYVVLDYVITLKVVSIVLLLEALAGFFFYKLARNINVCMRYKRFVLQLLFLVYIILMLASTLIRFTQDNVLIQQAYSWVWGSGTLGAGILLMGFRLHTRKDG